MKDHILASILKLDRWLEENDYKGYEPFDGLTSSLHFFTLNSLFLMRILQQIVLRSPFHIRPWLGIKPREATAYALAFFAQGYLRLWRATGEDKYRDLTINLLGKITQLTSPGYHGACWGNNFDYASRGGRIRPGEPTIVWTSHIGHAFLDAYELFGDHEYLSVAESACNFIVKDLQRVEYPDGSLCISYVVPEIDLVHNANMLGASLLARTGRLAGDEEIIKLASHAILYSVSRQREDGSWYYGEAAKYHWVDNWHTAYNLDSLKLYIDYTGDTKFEKELNKGFRFYKEHFITSDGEPKYYFDKLHLVDIQSASQAIDTLCFFSHYDTEALLLAQKVAKWTIENMQDRSGYFYFRKLRWKKIRIPMLHWGQATMMSALSHLYLQLVRISSEDKS